MDKQEHERAVMIKPKALIIYLITGIIAIALFASFDAEFYFSYTDKLNLSDKMMRAAFTFDTETLTYSNQEDGSKADSYQLNDESSYVGDYKMILYYLDYMDYPDNDVFDSETQEAVQQYQNNKKLDPTGILDEQTMNALDNETPEYKLGQKGDAILKYQQILKALNYFPEETELNGTFGEETQLAVEQYQTKNTLTVTGTLNAQTQTSLNKNISEQVPAN
ncbi:MAG: peptidoglycan-binding protein [Anaerofustis sp.]